MTCEHRRIKKIFTHGRKSRPTLVCKKCGEIVNRNELAKEKLKRKKLRQRLRENE